eukprot:5727305-Amphidinium_carterae.1
MDRHANKGQNITVCIGLTTCGPRFAASCGGQCLNSVRSAALTVSGSRKRSGCRLWNAHVRIKKRGQMST